MIAITLLFGVLFLLLLHVERFGHITVSVTFMMQTKYNIVWLEQLLLVYNIEIYDLHIDGQLYDTTDGYKIEENEFQIFVQKDKVILTEEILFIHLDCIPMYEIDKVTKAKLANTAYNEIDELKEVTGSEFNKTPSGVIRKLLY